MTDFETSLDKPEKGLSFEEALRELEALVEKLESGAVDLDKAVDAYARGMLLKQHCQARLEEARLKVEQIKLPDNNGIATAQPFEPDPQ